MQAIMAAAIAVDAFYAVLRRKTEVSDDLVATWKKNRTSRAVQIAEILRINVEVVTKGHDEGIIPAARGNAEA